jgi:hypothetical protein
LNDQCVARGQKKRRRKKNEEDRDNYMHYARHKKNETFNDYNSFVLFAKIYIQHKEPVIGDFCCRVNFPFFLELLKKMKRIDEKKSNKCAHK